MVKKGSNIKRITLAFLVLLLFSCSKKENKYLTTKRIPSDNTIGSTKQSERDAYINNLARVKRSKEEFDAYQEYQSIDAPVSLRDLKKVKRRPVLNIQELNDIMDTASKKPKNIHHKPKSKSNEHKEHENKPCMEAHCNLEEVIKYNKKQTSRKNSKVAQSSDEKETNINPTHETIQTKPIIKPAAIPAPAPAESQATTKVTVTTPITKPATIPAPNSSTVAPQAATQITVTTPTIKPAAIQTVTSSTAAPQAVTQVTVTTPTIKPAATQSATSSTVTPQAVTQVTVTAPNVKPSTIQNVTPVTAESQATTKVTVTTPTIKPAAIPAPMPSTIASQTTATSGQNISSLQDNNLEPAASPKLVETVSKNKLSKLNTLMIKYYFNIKNKINNLFTSSDE